MSNERAPLGFGDELDNFDPAAWTKPKTRPANDKPKTADTKKAAEAAGFRSREPAAPKELPAEQPKQRRRRTGRNVQFNLKTRAETIEEFCRIADEKGMGLGEAFEFATVLFAEQHKTEQGN